MIHHLHVEWVGGDTLRIWDAGGWRLQHVLLDGTLLSDERLDQTGFRTLATTGFIPGEAFLLPDGSLLGSLRPLTLPDAPRDELIRPAIGYLRSSADRTTWDTVAFLPGSEQVHMDAQGPMQVIPLFPPHGRGWVASLALGTSGDAGAAGCGSAGGGSAVAGSPSPGVRICLGDQSDWMIQLLRRRG